MDDIDRAQNLAEQDRAMAIARARSGCPDRNRPSAEICADCGDPIPALRQRLSQGCTRCITCQREADGPPT